MSILRKYQKGPGDGIGPFVQGSSNGFFVGVDNKKGKDSLSSRLGLTYKPGGIDPETRTGLRAEFSNVDKGKYGRFSLEGGKVTNPFQTTGTYGSAEVAGGNDGYGYIGKHKVTGGLGGYFNLASSNVHPKDESYELTKNAIGAGGEARLNFTPRDSNFDFFGRARLGGTYTTELLDDKLVGSKFNFTPNLTAGVKYRFK